MRRRAIFLILPIFLTGCVHNKKSLNITSKHNKQTKKLAINISPILLPPPTLQEIKMIKKRDFTIKHPVNVKISFSNVDLQEALLALAKATGYSIVIPPNIKGKVSMELSENTIEDCLDALLKPFGYSYKIIGKRILIISKVTRIFRLNFPLSQRDFRSSIDATVGSSTTSTETASTSGTASMSVSNKLNLKFWENVEKIIREFLKEDVDSFYSIEPSSGTIVVSARPGEIIKISKFIKSLNKFSEYQVLIEAKIVEVTLNKNNQTGVNWELLTRNNFLGAAGSIVFNSPVANPNNSPFQLKILKSDKGFSFLLGILSQFGKVNVLSSPRIIALNGQPAMIKVGKDYIIIYQNQTTTSTSTGGQTATTLVTQSVETTSILTEGVILTIVPKIISKNELILNITPAISSLDTPLPQTTTSGFENKIFTVNVRQLSTIVRAKNGETIILGGLMAETKNETQNKIPILGDLPLIGFPFRSSSSKLSKAELIIMLTPHIEEIK